MNDDGVIVNTQDEIVTQVFLFYKTLFSSQVPDSISVNRVLSSLTKKLSIEDSEWCDVDFTTADFELAFNSLNGKPVTALLDSGSSMSFIRKIYVPCTIDYSQQTEVLCVHGDCKPEPQVELIVEGDGKCI